MFSAKTIMFVCLLCFFVEESIENCISLGYNEQHKRNYFYDGSPITINNSEAVNSILQTCPNFAKDRNEFGVRSCCDEQQFDELTDGVKKASQFVDSACYNAASFFLCAITCAPHQSDYMAASKIIKIDNHTLLREVELAISTSFKDEMFDVCAVKGAGSPIKYITKFIPASERFNSSSGRLLRPLVWNSINESTNTTLSSSSSPSPQSSSSSSPSPQSWSIQKTVFSGDSEETQEAKNQWTYVQIGTALSVLTIVSLLLVWNGLGKCKNENGLAPGIENFFEKNFTRWGLMCANWKLLTITLSLLFCLVLSAGNVFFESTSDPIDLWTNKNGRAMQEKAYYDQHFQPFYRTVQVYLRPKSGSIFEYNTFMELVRIESELVSLKTVLNGENISLSSVCFKPILSSDDGCMVISAKGYFERAEDEMRNESSWLEHLQGCMRFPLAPTCRPKSDAIVMPSTAFGRLNESANETLMIVTILLNNYVSGDERLQKSLVWEQTFLQYAASNLSSAYFDVTYFAERSIQDEIERESKADMPTIISSYLVMFVYMSLFLGSFESFKNVLLKARFTVGLCALLTIVLSVTSSFGFYSYLRFKTSIIVLEVTPFLMLAVGSGDNFIFVKNYLRNFASTGQDMRSVEEKVAANFGQIGPSLLLSSICQATAFGIGAIVVELSAIRIFALYSSLAVMIKFVLQSTLFVSIFALDCRRQESERIDIFCCVKSSSASDKESKMGISMHSIFEKYFCPLLNSGRRRVKLVIIMVFVAWSATCLFLAARVQLGLDQKMGLPKDSYLKDHLEMMDAYSIAGPPMYIILQHSVDYRRMGSNFSQLLTRWDKDTVIGLFPFWYDHYAKWLANDGCQRDTFCGANNKTSIPFCAQNDHFADIEAFLNSTESDTCYSLGKSLFKHNVQIQRNRTHVQVAASYILATTRFLKTESERIEALRRANQFSDSLSKQLISNGGVLEEEDGSKLNPVFIYSPLNIYYEQYLNLEKISVLNIALSILGVCALTFILLGFDFHSSLITLLLLILTITDMFGIMYLTNVHLNAVSLVNLIMSVGIAVEFYAHIVREYASTGRVQDSSKRITIVLSNIGSSIFTGVTIPELVSVSMLSLAKSAIFNVYFFRMYLALILTCTLKALILLPILLTFLGKKQQQLEKPESNIDAQ